MPVRPPRPFPDDGHAATLPRCPRSPNCVCSDDPDPRHRIPALPILGSADRAWDAAVAVISAWPRTRLVHCDGGSLHAECRTAVLRFVDDLELRLRADAGVIAVRSASRVGWSDLGVNRRRVERLRRALEARGVVAAADRL